MTDFTPTHGGLYFTQAHIDAALAGREREPLASAYQFLAERGARGSDAVLLNAFRSRFMGDHLAGEAAAAALPPLLNADLRALPIAEAVGEALMLAQTLEMLRAQPDTERALRPLIGAFGVLAAPLMETTERIRADDALALRALQMAAGIVLDDQARFTQAVQGCELAIREWVRPQGFIADAVEGKDSGSMRRSVRAAAWLVLMAEMAAHVGIDLWGLEVRGVSVMTAAIFPMYYFYVTKKWKWDADIAPEEVQSLYGRYGGYLEFVYRRNPHRDIRTVLNELRPVYTPHAGGLTTLSHALADKQRRGLFGRADTAQTKVKNDHAL